MISLEERRNIAQMIGEARDEGARLSAACEVAGIDARTLQRWDAGAGLQNGDARPRAVRPVPAHALSPQERGRILPFSGDKNRLEHSKTSLASAPPDSSSAVPVLGVEANLPGARTKCAFGR